MEQDRAGRIVDVLRSRGVFAHVHRAGVFQFGVRVVIPDGREAVWDADGAAGLEATIMRDGMLVGMVPTIPGSDDYDDQQVADTIATADYGEG